MPRIGELLGVVFYLYYIDHKPDHIHAFYRNMKLCLHSKENYWRENYLKQK